MALLLYPVAFMGDWLPGLDDRFYGVFVGASIYELAQVYGASFAVSEGALNTATLVKLSKVLMLVPLLVVLGLLHHRGETAGVGADTVPLVHCDVHRRDVAQLVIHLGSAAALHRPRDRPIPVLDGHGGLGLTTRLALLREAGGAVRIGGAGVIGLLLSTCVAFGLVAPLSAARDIGPLSAEGTMLSSVGGASSRRWVARSATSPHSEVVMAR